MCILNLLAFSSEIPVIGFRCNFNQDRYIKKMDMVLYSTGDVMVESNNRIIWRQYTPFKNSYVIQKDGVYEIQESGKEKLENPIIEKISTFIGFVLQGHYDNLSPYFSAEHTSKHSFSLKPIDKQIQKFIKDINVTKKTFVESFSLNEMSGNSIIIKFDKCKNIKK